MEQAAYRHCRNQVSDACSSRKSRVSISSKSFFISTETVTRSCTSMKTKNLSYSPSSRYHSSSSGMYQSSSLQRSRNISNSASEHCISCFLNTVGLSTSLAAISASSDFFHAEVTLIFMAFAILSSSFLSKAMKNCFWVR